MGERYGSRDADPTLDDEYDADDDQHVSVVACETRPGRVVFTEDDNTDAWIATDLTIDVER
jgi:hypothetical protein